MGQGASNSQGRGTPRVNISDFYDGSSVGWFAALRDAQAEAVRCGATLVISERVSLAAGGYSPAITLTQPIEFQGDGAIDVSAGGSVTLVCPVAAPLSQVFFLGTGTLTFTAKVAEVFPEWFGAIGDGVADDAVALGRAMTAAAGGILRCRRNANYRVNSEVSGPTNITLDLRGATVTAGAAFAGAAIRFPLSANVSVIGGEVNANYDLGGADYGIKVDGGSRILIDGVYIHDTGQAGIWVDDSSDVWVRRNRVVNCGRNFGTNNHGIMVGTQAGSESGIYLTENRVTGAYRKGITTYIVTAGGLRDITIANNVVTGCGLSGVFVASIGFTTYNVTITGNISDGNQVGLEVSDCRNATVTANTVSDCTGTYGIYCDDLSYSSVSDNTVNGAQQYGIRLDNVNGAGHHNRICDNVVTSPNLNAGLAGAGIVLTDATYCHVRHNTITDPSGNMDYGVLESGTANNNQIGPNLIIGASAADILLVGAASTLDLTASANISSFGANVVSDVSPAQAHQALSEDGFVQLSGRLFSSLGVIGAGTVLCTLDAAYRPTRTVRFAQATSNNSIAAVIINAAGQLTSTRALDAGTGEGLYLDGVRFKRAN